jgi:hypothetical protein
MPSESVAGIVGPAGVGALAMLSIFLFLDGRAPGLFPTVETYAKTATWGIVAAVPLLVIAYVIGLFMISGMEIGVGIVFQQGFDRDAVDLAQIASLSAEKSAAIQTFVQLKQDRGVLAGSSFALLLLAAGASSEIRNLTNLKASIVVLAVGVAALAAATFYLAGKKGAQAHRLAHEVAALASIGSRPTPATISPP